MAATDKFHSRATTVGEGTAKAPSASAEEAAYAPRASYTASAAVTLYAVWAALGLAFVDNGASVEAYQVFIEDGSAFGQYAPFVDYGTSWEEMS